MNDRQNELRCEIVNDLLPLYVDGVVNTVTQDAVAAHLETCESCAMEYRLLKAELPTGATENTPKSKFATFAQKLKKKRVITAVIAVVLACVILISGFYVLTEVPLVPISTSEYQIYAAYRYEMDGNEHFFVMYAPPTYYGPTSGTYDTVQEENTGEQTFIVKWRRPVLARRAPDIIIEQVLTTSFTTGNYDTLKFNNTVIWSEAENGSDPVPEYVYAYAEIVKEEGGVGYDLDFGKNMIRIHSESGWVREWDLDGNLLYDSAAETP